jgi:ammonia channel protein AmtB
MMMMSFVTIGIVSTLWVFYGYNWAFGSSADSKWIGGFGFENLGNLVNSFTTPVIENNPYIDNVILFEDKFRANYISFFKFFYRKVSLICCFLIIILKHQK